MTTLVAVKSNNKVAVATDSLVSSGGEGHSYKNSRKLYRASNRIIFAHSGSVREENILRHQVKIPKLGKLDPERWLVSEFIPLLTKTFHKQYSLSYEKGQGWLYSAFLAVIDGRLFSIYGDLSIAEYDEDYITFGSGGDYALGSLYATRQSGDSAKKRAIAAVSAAMQFDKSTGGKIHTETMKVKR